MVYSKAGWPYGKTSSATEEVIVEGFDMVLSLVWK